MYLWQKLWYYKTTFEKNPIPDFCQFFAVQNLKVLKFHESVNVSWTQKLRFFSINFEISCFEYCVPCVFCIYRHRLTSVSYLNNQVPLSCKVNVIYLCIIKMMGQVCQVGCLVLRPSPDADPFTWGYLYEVFIYILPIFSEVRLSCRRRDLLTIPVQGALESS